VTARFKNVDRALACILLLGALGHSFGSFEAYARQPATLLWALCASVLVALLGVLNLLRANRPGDRPLAWITVAGTACWLAASIAFGILIHKPFDLRVVIFSLASVGLIGFGLKTAFGNLSRQHLGL
jgi:hypothetical protein